MINLSSTVITEVTCIPTAMLFILQSGIYFFDGGNVGKHSGVVFVKILCIHICYIGRSFVVEMVPFH